MGNVAHLLSRGIKMYKKVATSVLFAMFTLNVWAVDPIVTDSTSNSTSYSKTDSTTTVKSPPPTAVAPAVTVINSDVCAVGASAAVQTQILGISMGGTTTDKNCERDRKSTRLNSSHTDISRMPSSA